MPANLPQYRAESRVNAQGETLWTIRDLPIVSAHEIAVSPREIIRIDEAWLRAALLNAQTRAAEGYLPPLNVRHHEFLGDQPMGPSSKEPVARFLPTRVAAHLLEGKSLPTMFADLVDLPDRAYALVKAGQLAYRSVEIFNVRKPDISVCSMLKDEPPAFKYALLTGDNLVEQNADWCRDSCAPPLTAYAAVGDRLCLVYRESITMADEKKPDDKKDEPKSLTLADIMAAIGKMSESLAAYIGAQGAESKPDDEDEAKDGEPAEQKAAKNSESGAKDEARLALLEGEVRALKSSAKAGEVVRSALKELDGFVLGEGVEEKLHKVYREHGGEKGVALFVETVKTSGAVAKEPGDDPGDGFAAGESLKDMPPEVQKYANDGPDELARVLKSYQQFKQIGERCGMTLERWLAADKLVQKNGARN